MSSINSQDSRTWINQAKVYLQHNQHLNALKCVHQGLAVSPRNPEAWLQCGSVLQQLGFYEEAIAANHNAQRLFGSHAAKLTSIPLETVLSKIKGQTSTQEHSPAPSASTQTSSSRPVQSSQTESANKEPVEVTYDFWWKRAQACTQKRDYAAALSAYDKAIVCKPDQAQAWYRRGLVLFYLHKFDLALSSFERAIEYQPNLYQAWNNRASILIQLGNFEEAINSYEHALRWTEGQLWQAWDDRGMALLHTRGLEAGLAAWEEGIDALWCDSEEYQFGCGSLHRRKGDIQTQQAWQQTNPQALWRSAKVSYLRALELLDFQTFPEQHLKIWHSLLQVRLHLQETTAAKSMLLEAAIKLQAFIQNPKLTPEQCRQFEQQFAGFQQMQVDGLILRDHLKGAILWTEQCKDRALGRWQSGPDYEAVQLQYAAIQALLNPRRAIVCWHVSPAAVSTFILKQDSDPSLLFEHLTLPEHPSQDDLATSPTIQSYRLQTWLRAWQKTQKFTGDIAADTQRNTDFWLQGEAKNLLAQLNDILAIPTLCETVLTDIEEVILIVPPRWRSIPLQFLFPEQLSLTLLPGLQIGLNLLQVQSAPKDYLLNIVPPADVDARGHDNKLAELETFAISQSYRQQIQLSGPQLSQKTVMAALKVSRGRVHFAGLVKQHRHQPNHTGLVLTPQDRLSLSDLMAINWQSYSLVCLAGGALMTSQSSFPMVEVDLETILLSAGVQHVITSLWTVNHFSRVLLMARLHTLLAQNCNPVHALKQTQHWLRTITYSDVIQWCNQLLDTPDIDPRFTDTLTEVKAQLQPIADELATEVNTNSAKKYPYHHPWYWAGFIVVGNFPEMVV